MKRDSLVLSCLVCLRQGYGVYPLIYGSRFVLTEKTDKEGQVAYMPPVFCQGYFFLPFRLLISHRCHMFLSKTPMVCSRAHYVERLHRRFALSAAADQSREIGSKTERLEMNGTLKKKSNVQGIHRREKAGAGGSAGRVCMIRVHGVHCFPWGPSHVCLSACCSKRTNKPRAVASRTHTYVTW